MIAVTLICVALGVWAVRFEYLHRWAVFHRQEAQRYAKTLGLPDNGGRPLYGNFLLDLSAKEEDLEAWGYHARLGQHFERAKKRPWMPVEDLEP